MAAISFKHVGEGLTERRDAAATNERPQPPLGPITPVRAGDDAEGIFKMHRDIGAQIADNLRNLLLTNHGDRVMKFDFGANLKPLTFELTSQEDFDTQAMLRIKRAVGMWMPFVTLNDFESKVFVPHAQEPTGRIDVKVTYDVRQANIRNASIVVTFWVGG